MTKDDVAAGNRNEDSKEAKKEEGRARPRSVLELIEMEAEKVAADRRSQIGDKKESNLLSQGER